MIINVIDMIIDHNYKVYLTKSLSVYFLNLSSTISARLTSAHLIFLQLFCKYIQIQNLFKNTFFSYYSDPIGVRARVYIYLHIHLCRNMLVQYS